MDLRNRVAFAAGHVAGTLNFGLDGSFATYLGWLIPWGTPLTLLGETPEQVAQAQRELVRIGIDRPAAAATGTPAGLGRRPSTRDTAPGHLRRPGPGTPPPPGHRAGRPPHAWNGSDGHLPGALHIPLHELPARLADVPDGEVWVHCAAGYRAAAAASLLAAAGRHVVHVDDEFTRVTPPTSPPPHHRPPATQPAPATSKAAA